MPPAGYFIDANLLVLLIVGSEDRDLIARHRRLKAYTVDDYELLLRFVADVQRVLVTPNTLTEASNLIGQHGEPQRSRLMDRLGWLIRESDEIVVQSAAASANPDYRRLGLTDAALLEVVTAETPVLTVDLDLYLAASRNEFESALNFTHYRDL